jgi:hypothetical protein
METAPCARCGSIEFDRFFVKDHGVNHVTCLVCDQEWIE